MREKLREEGMFAAIIGMALGAASALCLVVGLLSAPARAETLDELYTKAKTEKSPSIETVRPGNLLSNSRANGS